MAINTDKAQLGIGSNALSWDTLNQLKEADKKASVGIIDKNITTNLTKQKDLTAIKTLLSTFRSSVSSLTDDTSYLKRKVNSSGSGSASISASTGVAEQNVRISVNQLATQSVFQSKRFELQNDKVATTDTAFEIGIGGKSYTINVNNGDTLSNIAEKINSATEGAIQAKVLNVGGDKPYSLIIQSKETGKENEISFKFTKDANGSTNASQALLADLGFALKDSGKGDGSLEFMTSEDIKKYNEDIDNNLYGAATKVSEDNIGSQLETAQNASFVFNDIKVERSKNSIDDLISGVTITLNKKDEAGESSSFNIVQNGEGIVEDLDNMVKAYNALINNLSVATDYNAETGSSGTFQGVNEVVQIRSKINQIINAADPKTGKSINDFGLSMTKDGLLTIDTSKVNEMMSSDFENFQAFFASKTTYENVSYTGKSPIAAGEIDGSFLLNGKKIEIKTEATNTAEQNQRAILRAIAASGADVDVKIDENGALKISSVLGGSVKIEEDSDGGAFPSALGIEKTDLTGTSEKSNGFFKQLKDVLDGMVGTNGTLTTYEESLVTTAKTLNKEKETAQERLDTKYDVMAEKWAKYDTMIAALDQQFNALKQMIEAEYNNK